jgi:hypothetical protein
VIRVGVFIIYIGRWKSLKTCIGIGGFEVALQELMSTPAGALG